MLGDACWLHFLFGSSYVTFLAFLVSDLLCLSREVQKHLEPEQNVQTLGGDHTLTDVHRVVLCRWERHQCTIMINNAHYIHYHRQIMDPSITQKTETSHPFHPFLKGREHLEFAVRNFIGISAVFFLATMHLGPGWMSHVAQWSEVPLWCHDRMPIKLINHQKMKK